MTNLSHDQEEMRQSIQKSAAIGSIICAAIIAAIIYWILGDKSTVMRIASASAGGVVVLVVVFKLIFSNKSKSAQCKNCSAAFSISKTDHVETLKSSAAKETREAQEDYSTKVTTWTEEIYDITDTYTCSGCADVQTKEYTSTRKKDEQTEIEPAPVKNKPTAKNGGKPGQAGGVSSSSKSGSSPNSKTKK